MLILTDLWLLPARELVHRCTVGFRFVIEQQSVTAEQLCESKCLVFLSIAPASPQFAFLPSVFAIFFAFFLLLRRLLVCGWIVVHKKGAGL